MNPVQEILPPPSSHQKEDINFKTPGCQGLNLSSVTFKIPLTCYETSKRLLLEKPFYGLPFISALCIKILFRKVSNAFMCKRQFVLSGLSFFFWTEWD